MLSTAAGKASSLNEPSREDRASIGLINQKIWLPKLVYGALPLFYLVSGVAAFLATVYISDWFWVLPHYVLFSAFCVHLAFHIYRKRRRKSESHAQQR